MARSKTITVLLRCSLEDGKMRREPGERAVLPAAEARSLADSGLAELLETPRNGREKTPPAGEETGTDSLSENAGEENGAAPDEQPDNGNEGDAGNEGDESHG
ncbi:hypothetical protein [Desulfovibrio sp. ZJ200]|uniref:hypothetical protein n=1 Tax=Desulfovibrio sp. ZJ200 TaxID=2709792 RepID=UPI0013EC8A2D|nr:hypothetical protein [Desulfovibrio sp. ZJ200]